jgi:hypothetical protein
MQHCIMLFCIFYYLPASAMATAWQAGLHD